MAESIKLDIVEPINLKLGIAPSIFIGSEQVGPRGEKGDMGIQGEGIGDHNETYDHQKIATSVQSEEIRNIVSITAAEYALLNPKLTDTIYLIAG